jgi:3',5'-nucleoside bisphosphate phosphatase
MVADLHLHTNYSDGTYTPEELVAHAHRQGLSAIALTDHDTMDGCVRAATACAALGLEFITGSELTAEIGDTEIHLLGYFLRMDEPRLVRAMSRFQSVRQQRISEMVARLNQLGVGLQAERVFSLANCQSPGRPHVARALVEGGYCGSVDEAFERYLKQGRPAWVPKFKMSAMDGIALIHGAGGVAVLAHPGLNRVDEAIPQLVKWGLDGLECYHTKHATYTARYYVELAQRLGLLITGGSDCHGMAKGKPLVGSVRLPYEHVVRLKAARRVESSV